MKFLSIALSLVLVLSAVDAEAKRLGGSRSVGKQSNNVTQREATPPAAPTAPAQNAAAAAPAKPAAAPAAAPAARKPWGGMLAGLAAGLGLAWLASSLGLGEAFGQFILIALVVMLAMLAFSWFMRSRRAAPARGGYAFQGAGAADATTAHPAYRPENVGNDASARPWERSQTAFDGSAGRSVVIGSALASDWSVPAGFDAEGFLKAAKSNFILLQAAWDQADMATLRAMMTDEMLEEINAQLAEREQHTGGAVNLTEVQMLQAQLLGIEELGGEYMASVEFSGMIREDRQSGPSPFREVWNMTKPKDGSRGWLVAGVQALQ
jgi:predicted lipid-binding transport protein (Tim44 family)